MPTKRALEGCVRGRRQARGVGRSSGVVVAEATGQPSLFHLLTEDACEIPAIPPALFPASGQAGTGFHTDPLAHLNLLALRVDPEGYVVSANLRAVEALGCPEGQLRGLPVQSLITSLLHSTGTRLTLHRLLSHPDRHPTFQAQLLRSDKRRLWVKWSNTPVYDEQGNLAELIWAGLDITDVKQAEQGFLAYQEQVQTVTVHSAVLEARERQSMADAIHEDIAQDLAYWRLQLAALQQHKLPTETGVDLGRIVNGVGTLIQRLRDFAFQLSPTILYRMGLKSAIVCLAEQVGKRYGLAVHVESQWLEEELPERGLSEEVRLVVYQAVRELLTNAATHGAATEIKVTLESGGGELVVEVADNGTGFDPHVLQPGRESRGLGLISLQQMLAHLGGRLLINSSPGQAACLTVVVPHPERHPDLTEMA